MTSDRCPERLALVRIGECGFVGTLCDAQCLSRDADAGIVEGIHGDWESLT